MGEDLLDESTDPVGMDDGCSRGGVVPNELLKLEEGDMSRGDRGGVELGCPLLDQMFCPGKEPRDMLDGVASWRGDFMFHACEDPLDLRMKTLHISELHFSAM